MLQHLCYLREASIRPERVQGLLHFRHDVLPTSGCSEHVPAHGCRDGTPQADSGGGGGTGSGLGRQTLEVPAPGNEGVSRLGEGRDSATPVRSPSNRDGGPATAAALAPRTATGNQDWKANADSKDKEAEKGQQPRGKSPAGLAKFFGPPGQTRLGLTELGRTGAAAIGQGLRPGVGGECQAAGQALPASRGRAQPDACGTGLRHHDGDPGGGGALQALSAVHCWKEKKEKGEVDCSLRLALFLGLCQVWLERMRALEAATAEAQALRERIIELRAGVHPGGPVRTPLAAHEVGSDNLNADEARRRGAPQAEPDREQPHGTPAGDLSPYGVAEVSHVIHLRGGDRDLSSLGGATGPQSCTGLGTSQQPQWELQRHCGCAPPGWTASRWQRWLRKGSLPRHRVDGRRSSGAARNRKMRPRNRWRKAPEA